MMVGAGSTGLIVKSAMDDDGGHKMSVAAIAVSIICAFAVGFAGGGAALLFALKRSEGKAKPVKCGTPTRTAPPEAYA